MQYRSKGVLYTEGLPCIVRCWMTWVSSLLSIDCLHVDLGIAVCPHNYSCHPDNDEWRESKLYWTRGMSWRINVQRRAKGHIFDHQTSSELGVWGATGSMDIRRPIARSSKLRLGHAVV